MSIDTHQRVNIRPGVSVLSVLKNLNYKPWFALAEFVDNSIQSFLDHRKAIKAVDGRRHILKVSIEIQSIDGGRIVIRDNAAGIHEEDYPRAFRPAQVPPDTSGLCEFGMGMKSAACWFSPAWHVRTSALGEATEKTVAFDINRIVRDEIEELDVDLRPASEDAHFTEIVLTQLHHLPIGRTIGKIKEHLCEIYRVFSREGVLELKFNGEILQYQEPDVLVASNYNINNEPEGDPVEWRKNLEFNFGDDLKAEGFVAIRKVGSTTHAGFSLFRRKRLIEGSGDEKYRPSLIFGAPNGFVYQRLYGELHLIGFDVTHTKDGFQWDRDEQPFLELLKEEIDGAPLPMIRQARNFRSRPSRKALREAASYVSRRISESIQKNLTPVVQKIAEVEASEDNPEELPEAEIASQRVIDLDFEDRHWRIILELSDDMNIGEWLEVSNAVIEVYRQEEPEQMEMRELIGLRLSLMHPFMKRFAGTDREKIEPLLRVAAALGLAEKLAREGGVRLAGAIRNNLNKILRDALSRI